MSDKSEKRTSLEVFIAGTVWGRTEQIRKEDDPIHRVERFFEAGFKFVEEDPARAQVLISNLCDDSVA